MLQFTYPLVKLIVNENIRAAERRRVARDVRRPTRPSLGRLFGLRRPIGQGA